MTAWRSGSRVVSSAIVNLRRARTRARPQLYAGALGRPVRPVAKRWARWIDRARSALPQRRVDQRVHHPAHHRLGLAIGRTADVLEDDHRLDAVDDRQRLQQALIRAGLHSLFEGLKRGGQDLGPLPATERLLLEQPRRFQGLVLERQLERGAHVWLVLGKARIGAVEQLVESLLGIALLR